MPVSIAQALESLLEVVGNLQKAFPKKRFTLDGRLLGDLGEILVEQHYDLSLMEGLTRHHDARCADGRMVQIKATMKDSLTFPAGHVPEYYLGIRILSDGRFEEVFNGPGVLVAQALAHRAPPKTNLHSISTKSLIALNQAVPENQRIPRRKNVL